MTAVEGDVSRDRRSRMSRRAAPIHLATRAHAEPTGPTAVIRSRGLSARIGADQLGHTRPSMTQDVYMSRERVHTEVAAVLDRAAGIPTNKRRGTLRTEAEIASDVARGATLAVVPDIWEAASATRRAAPSSRWPPRPSSSICVRVTSARRLTLPQPIARSSRSRLRRTIERPNRRASLLPAAPSGVGQSGCGSPAPGHLMRLSGDRIRTRLMSEPVAVSSGLPVPNVQVTINRRSEPSRCVPCHLGSYIAFRSQIRSQQQPWRRLSSFARILSYRDRSAASRAPIDRGCRRVVVLLHQQEKTKQTN